MYRDLSTATEKYYSRKTTIKVLLTESGTPTFTSKFYSSLDPIFVQTVVSRKVDMMQWMRRDPGLSFVTDHFLVDYKDFRPSVFINLVFSPTRSLSQLSRREFRTQEDSRPTFSFVTTMYLRMFGYKEKILFTFESLVTRVSSL